MLADFYNHQTSLGTAVRQRPVGNAAFIIGGAQGTGQNLRILEAMEASGFAEGERSCRVDLTKLGSVSI